MRFLALSEEIGRSLAPRPCNDRAADGRRGGHRGGPRARARDRPRARAPRAGRSTSPTSTATPPSARPPRSARPPGARELDVRDAEACRRDRERRPPSARQRSTSGSTTPGVLVTGHVWEHDEELRRTLFEVNSLGTINGSLAALEQMRPADRGHLINVVSLAGLARPARRGALRGDQARRDGVHARHARRPAPLRRARDQRLRRLPGRDLDADALRQARRPRRRAVVLRRPAATRDGRRRGRRAARQAAGGADDPALARRRSCGSSTDAGPRDRSAAAVDARRRAPPARWKRRIEAGHAP